jgi:uridine kinase
MDAFIIMKYGDESIEQFYKNMIKPILSSKGFNANRADELPPSEQILARIIHSIEDSGVVVCDLTFLSPNVMYELGIAHSLTKRVIMICQRWQELPFDLMDYEVLFYTWPEKSAAQKVFNARFLELLDAASLDSLNNPVAELSKLNNILMHVKVNPSRISIKPELAIKYIIEHIKSEYKKNKPYVVAISGAAGLGKTTLSRYLQNACEQEFHICPSVLSLDGYMLNRNKLLSKGISGYCKEAHDIDKMKRDIITLIHDKQSVSVSRFHHSTGVHSGKVIVEPSNILILDGVMAFCEEIDDFVDLRIFLEAKDKWTNMSLRFLVNLEQRGRSVSEAKDSAKREFIHYVRHLEKYRSEADFILIVDNNWNMEIASWTPWG